MAITKSNTPIVSTSTSGTRVAMAAAVAAGTDRVPDYHLPWTGVEVQNAIQKIIDLNLGDISTVLVTEITIPNTGWVEVEGEYKYQLDLVNELVVATMIPHIILDEAAEVVSINCVMQNSAEALNRAIRFKAMQIPSDVMHATAILISPSLVSSGGWEGNNPGNTGGNANSVVISRVGDGLLLTLDGVLSLDETAMTDADLVDEAAVREEIRDALNSGVTVN